ncbi:Formylglycine-generating enzyme, required for sulfatase activity, contains SUMF1/FGE domain [Devosia lucknowensis]|uniref:Formylglycine-generating enzyme, required for sulfatase activity, contains SUMF1/FGE domain n=1 Tax=Devosia lucknowensis TaxID=1096929 RepID=A0A1Y6G6M2_9HYPH|nr:formylglycine-generating enzyme family protein [Devosia lucknowensis]SMQ85424.1 Formylglycine-generating enzyme, required for sulfatase activity, contains SUMF1/FGE domain [Devosia lucknowensis]
MSSCCGSSRGLAVIASADAAAGFSRGGSPSGVIRVRGGRTFVGTDTPEIAQDGEGPKRAITLADFGLEAETVTVERFASFVEATGYVSEAEQFGWTSVFFGDSAHLSAASAVGSRLPWWHRVDGAHWRHPEGPGSNIDDRLDHPVTQVSWTDAKAFAAWVGGRLPTEAEWEHAARGGAQDRRFPWGEAEPDDEAIHANIWQGQFPHRNTLADGHERTAPARSFEPNSLGFYNMAGNVWEWTADAFKVRSLSKQARLRNAQALEHSEKVLKGGSFLCHISYCYRYRIAARMALSPDSAASNAGFRVAYDL